MHCLQWTVSSHACVFLHDVTAISLHHCLATISFDTIFTLATIVTFVNPLVTPLMCLTVIWRKEHVWNLVYSKERIFQILFQFSYTQFEQCINLTREFYGLT